MNIFISFAYTDTDIEKTHSRLKNIVSLINQTDNFAYCNLFDESIQKYIEKNDTKSIFKHTLKKEAQFDAVFVIINEPTVSNGQCIEIGVALYLNIPIIIFEHNSIKEKSYIAKLSNYKYTWNSNESLLKQIKKAAAKLSSNTNS